MSTGALASRGDVDHTPARQQSWADADVDVRQWCLSSTEDLCDALGDWVAVYLHGSLAAGSYYRPKSDLDLVIVVPRPLSAERRRDFAVAALAGFDRRPTVGGLEVSVLSCDRLQEFVHPVPFEAHFSETWVERLRHGEAGPAGVDADLAAHLSVIRRRSVTLLGPSPLDLLPEVPQAAFLAAVLDDFDWIVDDEHLLESPFYGVLNSCRTLQLLRDPSVIASKDEGAAWGLSELPTEHHPVIRDALACYRSAAATNPEQRRTHGHAWDREALLRFRDFAVGQRALLES